MTVEAGMKDAAFTSGKDVELPWDEVVDDPAPQDLVVPARPDVVRGGKRSCMKTYDVDSSPPGRHNGIPSMERSVSVSNDPDDQTVMIPAPPVARSRNGWTVVLLCVGLAIVACCVVIPQADANRRLAYERQKLQIDLEQIKNQTSVNKEFLKRIATDATLAERLAQRQMKMIPRGTTVLQLRDQPGQNDMSPFLLVNLPVPLPLPAYQPVGGMIADVCTDSRKRLYLLGAGLFLVAAGLVMGGTMKKKIDPIILSID